MTSSLALVVAIVGTGAVTFALAQSSAPIPGPGSSAAEIVKARQHSLKVLGAAFKTIRDELNGASPDAVKIRKAAADIAQAAEAIDKWFPAGTGPQDGVKTDARSEVWTDAAGFTATRTKFEREAHKLSNGSDVLAWRGAASSLGQTCRDCHEKYRQS